MAELRRMLDRAAAGYRPPADMLERTLACARRRERRRRIRAYATTTGVLIRSLVVRPGVFEIGVSGPRVVFAYPHSVMLWNVRHNLLRRLALTGKSSPGDLTISGRLVTWLQRSLSESTIRGVLLPPLQP